MAEERRCSTCKYEDLSVTSEQCRNCHYSNHWEAKTEKCCGTCKWYRHPINTNDHICNRCGIYDNWRPKEEDKPKVAEKDINSLYPAGLYISTNWRRNSALYKKARELGAINGLQAAAKAAEELKRKINAVYGYDPEDIEESLEEMCELWRKNNMPTGREATLLLDDLHHIYRAGRLEGLRGPEIKDVIFNNPATIVFWKDGTKTVVKCQGKEKFDPEKGLAMAIVKKIYGNKGRYFDQIKDWVEPYEEQQKLLKKQRRNNN